MRYCGTIGGNLGNGDPGNDMPAVMQCLDATYVLKARAAFAKSRRGPITRGLLSPRSSQAKCSPSVRFRAPPAGHGYAYKKQKRKVGDYATAAAAVILEMSGGKVREGAIALTNVGPTPI